MTSSKKRKPCAKCSTGKAVATCNGCHQMFCINHLTEHREELSNLMDDISTEHDFLRGELYQDTFEHPLLSRINTWERESIKAIEVAAQTARSKLQQIFTRKTDEIKPLVDKLTEELRCSQQSASYTENDIKKWTEKLTTLRKTLKDWSTVAIEDDNDPQSVIHLIKIFDRPHEESLSIVQSSESFVHISEDSSNLAEKFDKIDSELVLPEDNLTATYRSKIKTFFIRYAYGINRYSSGKHRIRLSIDKKSEASLFLGLITASKNYDSSFFNANNSSVYGWYNIESFVINGKSQKYSKETILMTGDELILIFSCDESRILLQHQRTKQLFQIPINLKKCPFPWKFIVGLSNTHDCIRIIH